MKDLSGIEAFLRLLHTTERVKRVARRPDETEATSTAEHSFELAHLCWYLVAIENLQLDIAKVFAYALAHDLIEAYAGDTYIFDTDAQRTKHEREAKALVRLEQEFSHFPDLLTTIHAYEARADEESLFVYAVDKLIDPLNASLEETQSIWKDFNISFDTMRAYKEPKITQSPHVVPYWEALLIKLEARGDFFFPPETP